MTLPRRGERGFTLVELLITVVIIAILTAIAVPAYITVVSNAQDSAAKQVLSSVKSAQEIGYAQAALSGTNDSYLSKAQLESAGLLSLGAGVSVTAGAECWVASSESDNGKTFYATNKGVVNTDGTTVPDTSWCAAAVAATVTNTVPNPRLQALGTWGVYSAGGTWTEGISPTTGSLGGSDYFASWTAPTTDTGGMYYSTSPLTSPVGKSYTSSIWVWSNVSQSLQHSIEWKSATATISRSYGVSVLVPANTWTRLVTTATAPTGTTFASGTVYANLATTGGHTWQAGQSLRVTAAMFTEGTNSYPFADSGTSGWVLNGDGSSTGQR